MLNPYLIGWPAAHWRHACLHTVRLCCAVLYCQYLTSPLHLRRLSLFAQHSPKVSVPPPPLSPTLPPAPQAINHRQCHQQQQQADSTLHLQPCSRCIPCSTGAPCHSGGPSTSQPDSKPSTQLHRCSSWPCAGVVQYRPGCQHRAAVS